MTHATQHPIAPVSAFGAASALSYAALSDTELEQHIRECGEQMQAAYARFERHGNLHDREEAYEWLHRQNAAIAARRPGRVVAMEACYFTEQGAADRARMGGAARA